MLATWAISELITGLYKLTQVSKDVAASAEEIGSAFNTTSSDLKDYEEKVEELNNTINNSSSSISEVTEARKQLLSVQNEMIGKYGTEQDSIDAITQAIHGNKNAWKELTKLKWQDAVNEFNKSGFVNDLSNSLHGYQNNLQRMQKEYGEYTATISFGAIHGHEAREQAKLLLSSFEGSQKAKETKATPSDAFALKTSSGDATTLSTLKDKLISPSHRSGSSTSYHL